MLLQGGASWGPAQAGSLTVGSVVRLATKEGVHAAEARVGALAGSKALWPSAVQPCRVSPGTVGVEDIKLFKDEAATAAAQGIMQAQDRPTLHWFKSYSLLTMMTNRVNGQPVGETGMLVNLENVRVQQQVSFFYTCLRPSVIRERRACLCSCPAMRWSQGMQSPMKGPTTYDLSINGL